MDYSIFLVAVDKLAHLKLAVEPIKEFWNSTFFGQHCCLVQVLIHYFSAISSSWNAQSELILGLILAVLRADLCSRLANGPRRTGKYNIYFPILLILIFGTSNSSTFLNGQPSISTSAISLCYFAAIYLLIWEKPSVRTNAFIFVLFCTSAVLGTYVFALTALMSIIVSFLLNCAPKRKLILYCSSVGALLSLLINSLKPITTMHGDPISLRLPVFFAILGRMFSSNLGVSFDADIISNMIGSGVFALCILVLIFGFQKVERKQFLGMSSLIFLGIALAFTISLVRTSIAPWYSTLSQNACIGLCFFCLYFLLDKEDRPSWTSRMFSTLTLAAICLLYGISNISFKNKDWYENVHQPASSSVIRQFNRVPTYGENYVNCAAKNGFSVLASLAEHQRRNRWSVFSRHQIVFLQGDFILDCVKETPSKIANRPYWFAGQNIKARCCVSDPRRLNLWLPTESSIEWKVDLVGTTTAVFKSKCLQVHKAKGICEVSIFDTTGHLLKSVEYSNQDDINLDLKAYSGNSIVLKLHSKQLSTGVGMKEPRIFQEVCNLPALLPLVYTPSNRNIPVSKNARTVKLVFEPDDWLVNGLQHVKMKDGIATFKTNNTLDSIEYTKTISVPFRLTEDIGIGIKVTPVPNLEVAEVFIQLKTNTGRLEQFLLPVPSSDYISFYSFKTRVLKFNDDEIITGIKVFPSFHTPGASVSLSEVQFRGFPTK